MSSNKYLDRVSAVILVITLIATILFMNGTALGITAVADEDAETYTGNEYFTDNDLNGEWSSHQLTVCFGWQNKQGIGGETQGINSGRRYLIGQLCFKAVRAMAGGFCFYCRKEQNC